MNNRMIVYQGNVDVLNQEEHNLNKQFVKNIKPCTQSKNVIVVVNVMCNILYTNKKYL